MNLRTLFLTCALFAVVRADFTKEDIQDDYSLRAGSEKECVDKLRFEGNDLVITPDNISLQDAKCEGGNINLADDGEITNQVTAFFEKNSGTVGSFLAGPVASEIRCDTNSLAAETVVVLVRPDDELDDVPFTDIVSEDSGIATNTDNDKWDFEEDRKYIFLGNKCFYAETNIGDRVECFPADATVTLQSGQVKTMDTVRIGDRVLVADGTYSDVFAWTHHTSKSALSYIAVETDLGNRLVTTAGHYVHADGATLQMRDVRKGMVMRTAEGADATVTAVRTVKAKGLYNPQTTHGDIVVNGLIATTYTDAVQPGAAHALLAPVRAAYKMVRAALPLGQSVEL
ncbi:unnamed protein product [Chondrus crispus]|uniref:Hint domain-containing protein n=1 Tax=Chondrus crispus TaxID=2769 RepID=R7Q8Q4_CHOCR|nr:unnamed protein product [Chondrus crispus]CDF34414.1 unnamed protein product [Chondrus crispus]|eukprot:XP_005714233.1 unnamed protein product [Chondrus crispus]